MQWTPVRWAPAARPPAARPRPQPRRSPSSGRSRSSGLCHRSLDQALQPVIGHIADHPRGDPAAARYHQCGGDPGGRHGVPEIERQVIARIVQARVADPEVADERLGAGRAVPDVDAQEPDPGPAVLAGQLGQAGRLFPARRAPRSPGSAPPRGRGPRPGCAGRRRPAGRSPPGRLAVAADTAWFPGCRTRSSGRCWPGTGHDRAARAARYGQRRGGGQQAEPNCPARRVTRDVAWGGRDTEIAPTASSTAPHCARYGWRG